MSGTAKALGISAVLSYVLNKAPNPSRLSGSRAAVLLATLLLACFASLSVNAEPESGQDGGTAALSLQAKLRDMQTYRANFQQTVFDEEGESLQSSSGVALVQRPGKMYWHSQQPFESLTISNDATLWHYDVDLEQVTRSQLADDLSLTPALILGSNAIALEQSFTVSHVDGDLKRFLLTPKVEDGVFSALEFRFDAKDVLIGMDILDSLAQRTQIVFVDAAVNVAVDESLFQFNVPPGVDLIDNGG